MRYSHRFNYESRQYEILRAGDLIATCPDNITDARDIVNALIMLERNEALSAAAHFALGVLDAVAAFPQDGHDNVCAEAAALLRAALHPKG